MSNPFFDHPILNSPYERPQRHWELDEAGQPIQKIIEQRRGAKFVTPIPKPKKRKAASELCFRRRQWAFHKGTAIRSNIHEIEFNGISVDLRYRVQLLTSITLPSID